MSRATTEAWYNSDRLERLKLVAAYFALNALASIGLGLNKLSPAPPNPAGGIVFSRSSPPLRLGGLRGVRGAPRGAAREAAGNRRLPHKAPHIPRWLVGSQRNKITLFFFLVLSGCLFFFLPGQGPGPGKGHCTFEVVDKAKSRRRWGGCGVPPAPPQPATASTGIPYSLSFRYSVRSPMSSICAAFLRFPRVSFSAARSPPARSPPSSSPA